MELDINMLLLPCEISPALFFKYLHYIYTPYMEIYTFINGQDRVKRNFWDLKDLKEKKKN